MRPYRILFSLAALYNLAFGLWAGLFPLHFFEIFDLVPPVYPSIWACLGMVVGIYATAYATVAWKPERGDLLVAIGFLGKILGPFGWLYSVSQNELPARTFPLVLFNDLIWWFPFLFYLCRGRTWRGRLIAGFAVIVHIAGCLGLLLAREGLEMTPSLEERWYWIQGHVPLWTAVWWVWVLCSLSFPAFVTAWTLALQGKRKTSAVIWTGLALACLGVLFDLAGEVIYITQLPLTKTLERFTEGVTFYTFSSAAVANGLYALAGIFMSVTSWKHGFLRGFTGLLGFAVWAMALALTITALITHRWGIVITAAATMTLFIPWMVLAGRRFGGR